MRKTYCEVNLDNLKSNVERIIGTFTDYSYYFGVVKADCYGHGIECVQSIIDGGCNYLAVATLKEALEVRDRFNSIPILCLGCIFGEDISLCISNDITISICNMEQLKDIVSYDCRGLKCHIKLNTGMNRLGICNEDELVKVMDVLYKNNIYIEGIYSHIYNASSEISYIKQVNKFRSLLNSIDVSNIKIIHLAASEALVNYERLDFVNGCRLGIIMYGFSDRLKLKSTFKVTSEVIQINTLNKGDVLGYNGDYVAESDNEKIAVVPIGYADGIIRKNKGRYVYINDKKYLIVGNICMDMLFVKVDDTIKVSDQVLILKDNEHIKDVSNYLETIPYEVMCEIGKRVERVYILK